MTSAPFKIRGAHVLIGMLFFFGLIIAINVAFAVAAVQTFPGEDEQRSYTQGLHYNDTLAERRAQAAIGWSARSTLVSAPTGARLVVRLADRAGQPVSDAALSGVLRWPPNQSGDRALSFITQGNGVYVADLAQLAPGQWDLRARAERVDGARDFEADLTWPSTH